MKTEIQILFLIFFFSCFPCSVDAREFKLAEPGYTFQFPRDHYSHQDYKVEWWYFTGHLNTEDKRKFGYQFTLFRIGTDLKGKPRSRWALSDIYFAHLALSDMEKNRFFFRHRISRAGPGLAGARSDQLRVWSGNWILTGDFTGKLFMTGHSSPPHDEKSWLPPKEGEIPLKYFHGKKIEERFFIKAETDKLKIDLSLIPQKRRVVNGLNGFDRKSSGKGGGSHYYSYTRLKTEGEIIWEGKKLKVTGTSWMDHEFCTNQLGKYQQGWDWFSIQLDNNYELMCYYMRMKDGRPDKHSSGTLVFPDGTYKHLSLAEFQLVPLRYWVSGKTGGRYPVAWTVSLPKYRIKLKVTADLDNQELNTHGSTGVKYWEGSVSVSGTCRQQKVQGVGYLEMTGYAQKFDKPI